MKKKTDVIGLAASVLLGLIGASFGFGASVGFAADDDTTLRGLRVTVTNINDFDVTIDVLGQGTYSSDLPAARLGSEFFYDYTYYPGLNHWTNSVPPAVDWGDGSTITNVGVPFTGSNPANGTVTFKGQFKHTYAAPGSHTIRSFGSNIYIASYTTPTAAVLSGNLFSVLSPGVVYNSGTFTNTARYTGTYPIGITNTEAVSVPDMFPIGGDSDGSSSSCGLIGIELLAVYPVWALARRRRRADNA
jgi:hypothetical protein